MTTVAAWYAALKGITVAGTTALAEPPLSAPSARLPALFVDTVAVDEQTIHKGVLGGQRVLKGRIVILMGSPGQDRQANRWSDTLTMADTLSAALRLMTNPTGGPLEWTLACTADFDRSGYWAVTANVQAVEWT